MTKWNEHWLVWRPALILHQAVIHPMLAFHLNGPPNWLRRLHDITSDWMMAGTGRTLYLRDKPSKSRLWHMAHHCVMHPLLAIWPTSEWLEDADARVEARAEGRAHTWRSSRVK